ncbi:Uncharacterised protein [Pseudomonas fluorescens]|uniref:Uncharacterized protein n=1 Tax=Pseudomonas fluorescens TaxID=294 RepID=A0A379IFE1_PSEFL|nr:Uncharacterised protein [Pseudomonas fluorescens]
MAVLQLALTEFNCQRAARPFPADGGNRSPLGQQHCHLSGRPEPSGNSEIIGVITGGELIALTFNRLPVWIEQTVLTHVRYHIESKTLPRLPSLHCTARNWLAPMKRHIAGKNVHRPH